MTSPRPQWALALLASALFAVACGKPPAEELPPGDDAGTQPAGPRCVPDPALIAQKSACTADDQCPCGAHCELGQCLASCTTDADCPGGVCDLFGRCRPKAEADTLASLQTTAPAAFTVRPYTVDSVVPGSEYRLHLAAGSTALGKVRVAAEDGVQVACADGAAFASECTFDNVDARAEATVRYQLTAAIPAGELRQVRLFAGGHLEAVSLTGPVMAKRSLGSDQGLFTGQAVLSSQGVGTLPTDDTALQSPLQVKVTAKLFLASGAQSGVLVLEDDSRLLHPSGAWIGAVTLDPSGNGTVDFPTFKRIDSSLTQDLPVEVLVDAPPAAITESGSPAVLSFHLEVREQGLFPGGLAPQAGWDVTLTRTDDLPADAVAPSVPADETATLDPARAAQETPWDLAFDQLREPATFDRQDILDGTVDTWAGTQPWLDACGRTDPGERAQVATQAYARTFMLAPVNTVSGFGNQYYDTITNTDTTTLAASTNWFPSVIAKAMNYATVQNWLTITSGYPKTDDGIICALHWDAFDFFVDRQYYGYIASVPQGSDDRCAQVAARYGCTVETAPAGITLQYEAHFVGYENNWGWMSSGQGVWTNLIHADKVCRLPAQPKACGSAISCWEGNASPTHATASSFPFGATTRAISGDLQCASGTRSAATALEENAERPVSDPGRLAAWQMRQACETDLDAFHQLSAPAQVQLYGAGANQLFTGGSCIDGRRWLVGLGQAAYPDPVPSNAQNLGRETYLQHLFQQWLTVHGFIAREAVESERIAPLIRATPEPGLPAPKTMQESLTLSLQGWAAFLHPRFAARLQSLSGETLYAPDYRLRWGQSANSVPDREQDTGLPVAMLDTLSAQLDLAEHVIQQGLATRDPKLRAQADVAVAHVFAIWPVAHALTQRAVDYASANGLPPPSWLPRYQQAETGLIAGLRRVAQASQALARGDNPLGIEDSDLPLYFLGQTPTATDRFSAISDYLLGKGASTDGWATYLVGEATGAMNDARDSWVQMQNRDLLVSVQTSQQQQREDDLKRNYGSQILGLCGNLPGSPLAVDVLSSTDINPNTCFYRDENPACAIDPAEWSTKLSLPDVQFQVCRISTLKAQYGGVAKFVDPQLDLIATRFADCASPEYVPGGCAETGGAACFRCQLDGTEYTAKIVPGAFLTSLGPAVTSSAILDAGSACLDQFPQASPLLPSVQPKDPAALDSGACYRGSLGEMAMTLRGLAKDIEIARQQLVDHTDAYDIRMKSCLLQQQGNTKLEAELKSHHETMASLREVKRAADAVANGAAAVKDCASGAKDDLTFGAAASVNCGAAIVEAAAKSVSDEMEVEMANAEDKHEEVMTQIANDTAEAVCANDAAMELVGVKTAQLQIERATLELQTSLEAFNTQKDTLLWLVDEGRSALAAMQGRAIRPLQHDYWLDEKLDTYVRKLRLARRAGYLAARAVEYELQASLMARQSVLDAATPVELDQALTQLRLAAASRRINGNAPADLKVVVSLRKQVLQLQDHSGIPAGQQNLTDVERFRLYLLDPQFAVQDESGNYLGQQIPFSVAPLGTLGLGTTAGVPVFAGHDCAERLWSVNASIQGGTDVMKGGATATRVDLLQSNAFYSQWCSDPANGPAFQQASVRPSHNLFRDPELGTELGADTLGTTNPNKLMSRARLQVRVNVPRQDFESDAFQDGSSLELAARGLYSEYALFIPAETLSVSGSDGLDLNKVDDVLLRFDYVSVAK